MTIIDWINQVLVHKKPWDSFEESEQKSFNTFIINRWLSMDKDFIEVINMFQKYAIGTLESREVYKWYCDVLPKGKRFNKYIKGKKSKKYDGELKNILCNYFECSKLQVVDYIELIPKEELKEILEKYGLEPKKIRKLIK
jgi:hypothetical protein|tara:strand:- start:407 stop:826 length:420 start_codon:yes stop_codon:yes gene_type:complete